MPVVRVDAFAVEPVRVEVAVGRQVAGAIGHVERPLTMPRAEVQVAAAGSAERLNRARSVYLELGVPLWGRDVQAIEAFRVQTHSHREALSRRTTDNDSEIPLAFLLLHRARLVVVDHAPLPLGVPRQQHLLDDLR